MFRGRGHFRGYALLLTLVMLALTAVAVATLARSSASEALAARQAERDLQVRWAEASSRRVLMPAMQAYLEEELARWRSGNPLPVGASHTPEQPPASVLATLELNGVRLVARVDDEQARPNLNHLLGNRENGQPGDVQRILAQSGFRGRLAPRPLHPSHARDLGHPPYASWGQLFPASPPEYLSGLSTYLVRPGLNADVMTSTSSSGGGGGGVGLTLWGDGTLNLWTASPGALHRVLDDWVGADAVADLLLYRGQYPDRSVRQLVSMLNLPPDKRAAAQSGLTDRSRAYAMWLAVTPVDDGDTTAHPEPRAAWSLTVRGAQGDARARPLIFRW